MQLSEETEEGGRFIITHANLSQASPELKVGHLAGLAGDARGVGRERGA